MSKIIEIYFDALEVEKPLLISNEEYHSKKEFLSASSVKKLLENPYEFLNPVWEKTKAFDMGSAVHSLILEPHKFNDEFAVCPSVDRRTKVGKEIYSNFIKESGGKTVLESEDYETCIEMSKSALSLEQVKILTQNGIAESSYFSEIDGVKVKCRPDYYREDLGVIIDVKTTIDASPDGFSRASAKYGYYIQASFYLDVMRSLGKPANKFLFLAVSNKAPFMIGLYELSPADLELGRSEYKRAFGIFDNIENYKEPIYRDTVDGSYIQTLTLPNYIHYKKGA